MKGKKPCRIDQRRLVTLFKDIKRLKSEETRFCFLIGSGASKSSGIKTGWELAGEWYKSLKDDLTDAELSEWENSIEGFDQENIGSFYPHLYKKRYETSPQIGYEEFKKLMEDIEPGIGYVILSQILSNERHNFVITTNFDYLVEDSVRMYTSKKPFSAGHETLAEFISSQTERPTIIKVHRDLFLHPFNDESDTQKLKDEWKNALKPILRNFNLLVIGYGGNDGSLMDYLKSIESEDRKAIYWCHRNEDEINDKINDLLEEKDFFVNIKGFDQLMISLNEALDYKVFDNLEDPDKHTFVKAAKKRIHDLHGKLKKLLDQLPKESDDVDLETKELFTGALKYLYEVHLEKDINKKNEIYQRGMKEYSNDAEFVGNYAIFLSETRKEYDKAEEFYKKAIEIDANDAHNIGNYAMFLSNIRKDNDKAEELYKKAIELNPEHADCIGNYALLLSDIREDFDKAEELYKKAIELNPDDTDFIGNYAIFLSYKREDYDKAEELYKKAIELNPNHPSNSGNYAIFLSDKRQDYDKAEVLYKKAIELNPEYADCIGNYAVILSDIREDFDQAEELYKRAIELNPNDVDFIGNYAIFLSDKRQDYDKAEGLYKRAMELDSNNSDSISNYALFLSDQTKEYNKAEELYRKAIQLNPNDANIIGNYAIFLSNKRNDFIKAEELFKRAIKIDDSHANNIANYSHHLIISIENFTDAEKHINEAMQIVDANDHGLFSELWFYRYAHYNHWFEKGEKELTKLISNGAKSLGWNLAPHIKIAKKNKHPNIKKLQEFADAITK